VRSLGSGVLNARGQIKVKPTLQLESHPNIYAIGDVIDWTEQKQVAKTPKHAQIAAANIFSQLSGGAANKKYAGQPELIVITNGKVGRYHRNYTFHSDHFNSVSCSNKALPSWASYGESHWATGSPV